MPTENRLLFAGNTTTSEAVISDGFNDISILYLRTTANFEIEVDSFLQLYITPDIQRLVKINYSSNSVLNTEQVFLIPQDYLLSKYNQRMVMYFSDIVYIELWGIKVDCCLEDEVNRIKSTTDNIYKHVAIRDAIDIIQFAGNIAITSLLNYLGGQLVGTIATQILAPALRKGFYILNPPKDAILNPIGGNLNVDFLGATNQIVNSLILPPANVYVDDTNFLGGIQASSSEGNISTIVKEFF